MSIRRMIPMGTVQRHCVVCDYAINARSDELTAHETECITQMLDRYRKTHRPVSRDVDPTSSS